jgi:hypothetical protein
MKYLIKNMKFKKEDNTIESKIPINKLKQIHLESNDVSTKNKKNEEVLYYFPLKSHFCLFTFIGFLYYGNINTLV